MTARDAQASLRYSNRGWLPIDFSLLRCTATMTMTVLFIPCCCLSMIYVEFLCDDYDLLLSEVWFWQRVMITCDAWHLTIKVPDVRRGYWPGVCGKPSDGSENGFEKNNRTVQTDFHKTRSFANISISNFKLSFAVRTCQFATDPYFPIKKLRTLQPNS